MLCSGRCPRGHRLSFGAVQRGHEAAHRNVVLTGGRYGLGSKDTPPSSIFALFKELEKDQPKERFTLGITDDVTGLSLPEVKPAPITAAAGTKECKFWGLGGDGTVGANKNSVKIIGCLLYTSRCV